MSMLLCIVVFRLILLEPPGETADSAALATAHTAVIDAAAFWQAHAPFDLATMIAATAAITTDSDVYTGDTAWAAALAAPDRITIIVVDNRVSRRRLLHGRAGGWSLPWDGVAVVTLQQTVGANALPAIIAHELGHVLFGLEDLYDTPGACTHTDIMCSWVAAYRAGAIGCASLAHMGYPCKRFHLPIALR